MDGLGKDRRIGRLVVFDSFALLWPKGQRRTDGLLSHQRGRWKSLESEWTHCCAYPLSKKSCFYLVIIFSSCICLLAVTLGFRHIPFDSLGMLGRAFGPFRFQMSPAPLLASPLVAYLPAYFRRKTVMLMIFLAALCIVSPFLLALKVTDLQSTLFRVIMECELGALWPHGACCLV